MNQEMNKVRIPEIADADSRTGAATTEREAR